ncbi:MAG: biotin transporter BioY [Dehalococcoidales bacterium]|nr:biotin transporter BioY [Dehalococcoidales bacterium]
MELTARLNDAKYSAFRWRHELSIPKKLALAIAMAAVTGLLAQVRFPLPWTPVPITGQTFAVLLAAVLMGKWWGGISMAIYGGLGWAGLPWFQGGTSGITATGGYVIGFVLATLFVGYFVDKYVRSRSFLTMLGLMLVANFVFIYIPGLVWLSIWLPGHGKTVASFTALLNMGMIPFIAGDITKAILAAAITRGVTTKRAFNGEVDKDKWANWRIP